MSIVFQNPGLVDLDAITTFGVNVKESSSPIGFFGTGFKYAVAVILRNGGRIDIYRGLRHFTFEAGSKTIRGKEFNVVWLFEHGGPGEDAQCKQLGFTTELGKNWEPWMAFREIHCNALDEGGRTTKLEGPAESFIGDDYTTIVVDWDAFDEVYRERDKYFLRSKMKPIAVGTELEIYGKQVTTTLFYRGIRAYDAKDRWYSFIYNITSECRLTEDRTLGHDMTGLIRDFFLSCEDEDVLEHALTRPKGSFEQNLNFDITWVPTSQTFLDVVQRLYLASKLTNLTAIAKLRKERAGAAEPPPVKLNDIDRIRLKKATDFCEDLGFRVTEYPIVVTESLGNADILGEADMKSKKIFLAYRVFGLGTKQVAQTVLEEFLHLKHELYDESRGMQEFLFERIISLGERVLKEAL